MTDFARDHAFSIAWFGLMTMVWLGWAQEDPPASWRWRLGLGSGVGVVLAGLFGLAVALRWSEPSALDGQYHWFGVLVAAEVVAAGVGCLLLALRGRSRWMAWWVAVVVAAHFVPLAALLQDVSVAALGLVQGVGLAWLVPRLRGSDISTSRYVGPVMGVALLGFALVSAGVFLVEYGVPWSS
ncbi:hypothetical protein J4H86_22290 [Spiractinospora alimapuensis]|uniref:hypothetical protein n=1 Tax=Spiractinospora alimapuensis TaxID=2820884 RepID=UPI001F19CE53|nr:hypothetical protein [Spiractinospora alimapuensis]QVQ51495.1 hypothetical protein J4H86_22290 [Spiractinospora alimapuensis]